MMRPSLRTCLLCLTLLPLATIAAPASAALTSYATSATDVSGSTGSAAVALGVPDYAFVNDLAAGFGTNTDVFGVGESAVFGFPAPLRNIAVQHDAILSAFVGGAGATDNANVQVEVSSDGVNFVVVDSFQTEEARDRGQDRQENDFEGVKHFYIEFGSEDFVTHIRLTNTAGTAEGLRLDSLEGLLPQTTATHAFEMRLEAHRNDFARRFAIRIKNMGGAGAVPIREIRHITSTAPGAFLQETQQLIAADDGDFICVENCVPDNGPHIPFSRHEWSTDGVNPAPAGEGLVSGRSAGHLRWRPFDTDANEPRLVGFAFEVTFADGFVHQFDYDNDVMQEIGNLYQKYLYFDDTPAESWPRPVSYYEFNDADAPQVPGLGGVMAWLALALSTLVGVWLISQRVRATSA